MFSYFFHKYINNSNKKYTFNISEKNMKPSESVCKNEKMNNNSVLFTDRESFTNIYKKPNKRNKYLVKQKDKLKIKNKFDYEYKSDIYNDLIQLKNYENIISTKNTKKLIKRRHSTVF